MTYDSYGSMVQQITERIDALQHDADNMKRLRVEVELVTCDGCGHGLPPWVMHPFGACALCDACWVDFKREMREVPRGEWDPNEAWQETWMENLQETWEQENWVVE